jgi:hypothetical protein
VSAVGEFPFELDPTLGRVDRPQFRGPLLACLEALPVSLGTQLLGMVPGQLRLRPDRFSLIAKLPHAPRLTAVGNPKPADSLFLWHSSKSRIAERSATSS